VLLITNLRLELPATAVVDAAEQFQWGAIHGSRDRYSRSANIESDQPFERAVATYASCAKENAPPSSTAESEKLAVSNAMVSMAA